MTRRIHARVVIWFTAAALTAAALPDFEVLSARQTERGWRLAALTAAVLLVFLPAIRSAVLRALIVGLAAAVILARAIDQLLTDRRYLVAVFAWCALAAAVTFIVQQDADRR